MINGEKDFVFPYTLWHLDEFDLAKKFPGANGVGLAMLLIGRAADARPENRPTLSQFFESLKAISMADTTMKAATAHSADLLRAEAKIELDYQQRKKYAENFVQTMYRDFYAALSELKSAVPDSSFFSKWSQDAANQTLTLQDFVDMVANQESGACLFQSRPPPISLVASFKPATRSQAILMTINLRNEQSDSFAQFYVFGEKSGLHVQRYESGDEAQSDFAYRQGAISDFLASALQKILNP